MVCRNVYRASVMLVIGCTVTVDLVSWFSVNRSFPVQR